MIYNNDVRLNNVPIQSHIISMFNKTENAFLEYKKCDNFEWLLLKNKYIKPHKNKTQLKAQEIIDTFRSQQFDIRPISEATSKN